MTSISDRGASAESIQHHYDVGNKFYSLWLDESMTYSCGLWQDDDDCLSAAQTRKIDYLISLSSAAGRERVLDIGCGWGSIMQRLVAEHGVEHVTGLTLSERRPAASRTYATLAWKFGSRTGPTLFRTRRMMPQLAPELWSTSLSLDGNGQKRWRHIADSSKNVMSRSSPGQVWRCRQLARETSHSTRKVSERLSL